MYNSANNYIVIMAGGVGTRFWPASREERPKQFLDITGANATLLQVTFNRSLQIVDRSNIYIISNAKYKELIFKQLPGLKAKQLLLEPSRNNTAPSVAYTALHLNAINKNAIFAVIPSDHVIQDEKTFRANMIWAFEFAGSKNAIVTLGIKPTRPDTGYGYIQFQKSDASGIHQVQEFKEKPDLQTARTYLASGDYLWNAGIFIWSVSTVLKSFKDYSPDILEILNKESDKFGSPEEQDYIDSVYPLTKKISVDFAILEHSTNIYTIPSDIGWSDLGTWNSLYDFMKKDDLENVVLAKNSLVLSKGNLVKVSRDDKLVVIKGLEDYIVIDDDDVLLIFPRKNEQEIKQLRESLKDSRFK